MSLRIYWHDVFYDNDLNGEWNLGEEFTYGFNGVWDPGEEFTDSNDNEEWDDLSAVLNLSLFKNEGIFTGYLGWSTKHKEDVGKLKLTHIVLGSISMVIFILTFIPIPFSEI